MKIEIHRWIERYIEKDRDGQGLIEEIDLLKDQDRQSLEKDNNEKRLIDGQIKIEIIVVQWRGGPLFYKGPQFELGRLPEGVH